VAARNVKSSERTLLLLSHFAIEKKHQRVTDIARALDLPVSSCFGLLGTLVDLGFLSFNELSRSYFPTDKVRKLGEWLRTETPLEEQAITWAQRLHTELGEAVAVSKRVGLNIEWIFTKRVTQVGPGSHLPVCRTNNGMALLCKKSNAEVEAIIGAHNEKFGRQDFVQPREMLRKVEELRGRGYVSGIAPITPDVGTICFGLSDQESCEEIVLTILVPARELSPKSARILDTVRRVIPAASLPRMPQRLVI
jgi:DNA-binding IclR family transcriptional regulator